MDRREIVEARALGRKLFGDRFNIFHSGGLWHFGRFLDNLPAISGHGQDVRSPWHRPQEVFGVGPTLSAAMAFAKGPARIYSIGGLAPGAGGGKGYRVLFDKYGRVRGYESPSGVFSRHFPGPERVEGFWKDRPS